MKLLQGNNIEVLKTLDAESVQCCVTSPPYFGLRDYGTAQWIGGTDENCDHKAPPAGGTGERSKIKVEQKRKKFTSGIYKSICGKCGALRVDDQIGTEATPDDYVDKLVTVFREVRRVLAPDGTLWLNLGDSYNGSGGAGGWSKNRNGALDNANRKVNGLKPKDLIGIPWMVAFALRADGWYLRSDIIWHKPNPMPESVTDRPTKSHEYLFLLSKSANYYYDAEAIAEIVTDSTVARLTQPTLELQVGSDRVPGKTNGNMKAVGSAYSFKRNVNESPVPGMRNQHREDRDDVEYRGKRNKRDVWTVTTKPYKEAHFAVFPPELIEPCVLAGSREGDTVLDLFNGSGTTGEVSLKWRRDYIGIELNPDYIELTKRRLAKVQPFLILP